MVEHLGLADYPRELENIENRHINLIYNSLFDVVCTREEFDKSRDLMEWRCAICGEKILINWRRYDVENFVCDKCKEVHNNKSPHVDRRIMNSRTKLYEIITEDMYQELEESLGRGRK